MILEEATSVVLRFMAEFLNEDLNNRRYALVRAELREDGWVFEYTSTEFLRTRSFVHALGGNLPLLVQSDGEVRAVTNVAEAGKPVCGG